MLKHLKLGVKILYLVVKQWVFSAFFYPRRAAYDHKGRLFSKSLCGWVNNLQPPNAIGNAGYTQSVNSSIGICSKSCPLFITHVDYLDLTVRQLVVESQHKVPRNTKNMFYSKAKQPFYQV